MLLGGATVPPIETPVVEDELLPEEAPPAPLVEDGLAASEEVPPPALLLGAGPFGT